MGNSKHLPSDYYILRSTKSLLDMEIIFNEKLTAIENFHKDYFESRDPRYKEQNHDFIQNHFFYLQQANDVRIIWEGKSDLKEDIKNEVMEAFNAVFVQ